LLDAQTGRIEKTFPNPSHYEYTYPVFSGNGLSIITGIRDSLGKMALARLILVDDSLQVLTPFILKPFGPPHVTSSYIFFPAALDGNVQLYAYNIKEDKLYQIADRPLGNYSIAVDSINHRFVFDEYTAKGYSLKALTEDSSAWQPVDWAQAAEIHNPYVPKALTRGGGNI